MRARWEWGTDSAPHKSEGKADGNRHGARLPLRDAQDPALRRARAGRHCGARRLLPYTHVVRAHGALLPLTAPAAHRRYAPGEASEAAVGTASEGITRHAVHPSYGSVVLVHDSLH